MEILKDTIKIGLILALSFPVAGLFLFAHYTYKRAKRERELKQIRLHCDVLTALLEHKNRIIHKYREDGAEVARFEMYGIAYKLHNGANAQQITQAIADFTETYLNDKSK